MTANNNCASFNLAWCRNKLMIVSGNFKVAKRLSFRIQAISMSEPDTDDSSFG